MIKKVPSRATSLKEPFCYCPSSWRKRLNKNAQGLLAKKHRLLAAPKHSTACSWLRFLKVRWWTTHVSLEEGWIKDTFAFQHSILHYSLFLYFITQATIYTITGRSSPNRRQQIYCTEILHSWTSLKAAVPRTILETLCRIYVQSAFLKSWSWYSQEEYIEWSHAWT